ncbi:hypothetical protein SERLADRAFT_344974, partial [Serpula lacrymans var. lacrymans S7.9]
LVFADKTHFNCITLCRPYTWAPHGGYAHRRDFLVRGKRYSILLVIALDGVIHLEVLDRPFTGDAFLEFIEGTLGQIQDPWNLRTCGRAVSIFCLNLFLTDMLCTRGMHLLYLLSYSPDLNPIEEAFLQSRPSCGIIVTTYLGKPKAPCATHML